MQSFESVCWSWKVFWWEFALDQLSRKQSTSGANAACPQEPIEQIHPEQNSRKRKWQFNDQFKGIGRFVPNRSLGLAVKCNTIGNFYWPTNEPTTATMKNLLVVSRHFVLFALLNSGSSLQ